MHSADGTVYYAEPETDRPQHRRLNREKSEKPVFFIVFAVIALFTLTTIFGVHTQFGDVVKTYVHGWMISVSASTSKAA